MTRGRLRVYLGAAPGVGKTYAMLAEGRRRRDRGADVVIGLVETHGRPRTAEAVEGLEAVPRRRVEHRGAVLEEMDLDAVLARRPELALVDELAHTDAPGGRHAKRWQDVAELLAAGIDVITTVNVQHLESLNDVVRQITGVVQHETVPDQVVRAADQVELVDMTAEALRRRLAHGNVYPVERVDAALGAYFRAGNLTALRELALRWLADKVDDQLDAAVSGEVRERVVVALTGGPEGDTLIRRAARTAAGADLLAVHVTRRDGLSGPRPADRAGALARQRTLVEDLGGTFHQVVGDDVPAALLDFARGADAGRLVLGVSRRGRLARMVRPGVGLTTAAGAGPIDVHLVSHDQRGGLLGVPSVRLGGALSRRRRLAGFALAAAGLPLLTLVLAGLRAELTLPSDLLLFLVAVVGVALVGGVWPAVLAAVAGSLLLNWWFTPPLHRFTVAERENVLALLAFTLVGVAVAVVVDRAARTAREAARASADAAVLGFVAGGVLRGERALDGLLDRLRETYRLTSATLLERLPDAGPDVRRAPAAWRAVAAAGEAAGCPDDGDTAVDAADGLVLVLRGPVPEAADRRVLSAFAAQAAVAVRQQRLAEEAGRAARLAAADRARFGLLAAVGHDLRTPLATARAAVDGLRSPADFSAADREELLAAAAGSLHRLDRLTADLLDLARAQSGLLPVHPAAVDPAASPALTGVEAAGHATAYADPVLLDRVLAALVEHARARSATVLVQVGEVAGRVEVRVADQGPPAREPFHPRLDDRPAPDEPPGLGPALARGLAEAMAGAITAEDTPGGGLTLVLTLPTPAPPKPAFPR